MLSGRADNSDWYLNFNLESKRNGVRLLVKKKKKKSRSHSNYLEKKDV